MGWDGVGWDGMGWDGMGWDGMGWDGMGWAGMGWAGMGWDGMGWDGMGWHAHKAVSRIAVVHSRVCQQDGAAQHERQQAQRVEIYHRDPTA
jgi:hypothetical protein